jgi:hypothetical protein
MNSPSLLAAGDSASWLENPFPANGKTISALDYTLMYCLRGTGAALDLNGVTNGSGWKFSLTTVQSAALNATAANVMWYWNAYASKSGERVLAGEGQITIKPNFASLATSYDGRTQAEKDFEAVKAEITNRISGGATLEYSIGNRQLKKEPIAELIKLQDRLKTEINRQRAAQRIANGQGNPGKVMVRFRRG